MEGITLTASPTGPGQKELRIATLNRDGILDYDRSRAFLFFDREEKLSHPASFNCQFDRNYEHIYQRLASFPWLAMIALIAIVWGIIFFAARKSDRLDFSNR